MHVWEELEWRGMVHQSTDPELGRLLGSERVVAYTGFDATADSLHVGHLVPIIGLQRLQRGGHQPIALVGGGTTMIGDPSGRETERPLLSVDEIQANGGAIRRQLERFLDFASGPARALMLDNAEWLRALSLTDFLRDVGKHFTVNSMLAKESVRARLTEREHGISYTEFSYMLLQAYDFLHLFDRHGCRLQLGGSDQWGNITAGIDLIRRVRRHPAYGLTWPLLTTATGTKFGKSSGANVWLDPARTSPYRFFQYWLNTDDHDVVRFLRLFTDVGPEQLTSLEEATSARPERRAAQQTLAFEVTARVHGVDEAERARRASGVLFGGADLREIDEALLLEVFADAPSSVEPGSSVQGAGIPLVDLVSRAKLSPSRSAARTAIEQGGIYVNARRERDPERAVTPADLLHGRWLVLRKGKKSHHLVRFE